MGISIDQMQTITLYEYDDGECHVELRYRGDGESFRYEMIQHPCDMVKKRIVLPLHPDFEPGYLYAAHLLTHIAGDLYRGKLQLVDTHSEEKKRILEDLQSFDWDNHTPLEEGENET